MEGHRYVSIHFSQSVTSLFPVDDGTGVIECVYRIEPQSPSKRTREPARSMTIADVGWPLRVTGKVAQWYETRELHNVTIGALPLWFMKARLNGI